ncbi:MAG TPA: multiheme c-type cytochrome, partial [Labilithrix sp.]
MKRAILATVLAAFAACTSSKGDDSTLPRATLLDPQTCQTCHVDHFKEWSGSMHAYASDDPVFVAMNKRGQRETGGQLGNFCVNCHAPMAVRENATTDGLNLASVDPKLKGVTCFFCHTAEAVHDTHNDPLDLSADPVMHGPFADPVANTAHKATYSALHDRDKLDSAKLCGACHDITTGHGAQLERTFAEWQASVFSEAPGGRTCGQCHMAQSANLQPIAQAPGVFARRKHEHTFPAIDSALTSFADTDTQKTEVKALLDTTLQSALCVGPAKNQIRVFVDNVAAGHSFPSGAAQDRRVWTEVIAYSAGASIYQSGVTADDQPIVKSTDPDLWLLRDCIFDDAGNEVRMFWLAASTESNALPAQAT